MLHNGNRINGHPRSEESIKLLNEFLVKFHDDGDRDSLSVRFGELQQRIESLECDLVGTWNAYLKLAEQVKK
jgi:hypothetical protein